MRRRAAAAPGPAAVVLLAAEREALVAGDAERLAVVRSWLAMLRAARGDPEVAGLFAVFALEDE